MGRREGKGRKLKRRRPRRLKTEGERREGEKGRKRGERGEGEEEGREGRERGERGEGEGNRRGRRLCSILSPPVEKLNSERSSLVHSLMLTHLVNSDQTGAVTCLCLK